MIAKEFALLNFGKCAIFTDAVDETLLPRGCSRNSIAIVVGYYDYETYYDTVISFQDPEIQRFCHKRNHCKATLLDENIDTYWNTCADYLKIIDFKTTEPVTPYPHKCNRCHSSARKIGGLYLCSNVRCGTHNVISHFYKKLLKYD